MPAARTTIVVNAAHAGYEVLIEPGLLGHVGRCVAEVAPHANALLAVDEQIAGRYGRRANASLKTAGYTTSTVPLPRQSSIGVTHGLAITSARPAAGKSTRNRVPRPISLSISIKPP